MTSSKNPLGQSINPWENPLILMDPSFLGPFFIEFLHVWCSPEGGNPQTFGGNPGGLGQEGPGTQLSRPGSEDSRWGWPGAGGKPQKSPWFPNFWWPFGECTHVQTLRSDFFLVKSWGYPKSSEWWPWTWYFGIFKPMVTGGYPHFRKHPN